MLLTIYREVPATSVRLRSIVDGGEAGPVVVDEVRHTTDDDGDSISLYGLEPGGAQRRRKHLRFAPMDMVRLVPTDDTTEAVWGNVMTAIATGARKWSEDAYDEGAGGVQEAPPWEVDPRNNTVRVRVAGLDYTVAVAAEPEPEGDDPPADPDA